MLLLLVAALSAVTIVHGVDHTGAWGTSTAAKDLVTSLPSIGNLTFPMHAGYVVVNQTAGRALYYVFTPAKTSPETAPLLLWLNGGPGCSSVYNGFAGENGPFLPLTGTSLRANPYPWNEFASVIYLDSPAFTGFSYSLTPEDKNTDDIKTTADTYTFLVQWFKRYPAYANHSFYLTGESYAGRYIPQAAMAVVQGNKVAPAAERINLKGVAIGNGVTDLYYDQLGLMDYFWSHDIISDEVHSQVLANCNFHTINDTTYVPFDKGTDCPAKKDCCRYWFLQTGEDGDYSIGVPPELNEEGGINQYQIYADWPCPADLSDGYNASGAAPGMRATVRTPVRGQAQALAEHMPFGRLNQALTARREKATGRSLLMAGSAPFTYNAQYPVECYDSQLSAYYNTPAVQLAMHANQTVKIPNKFFGCTAAGVLKYTSGRFSMLPLYRTLVAAGVKMFIFSGDVDAVVPSTGTRYGLASLKLKVVLPWAPWYSCTGDVGGRRVRYQGLDFFTVRNAGHEVPWYQGERGSFMMKNYLGIPHNCSYRCTDCTTGSYGKKKLML